MSKAAAILIPAALLAAAIWGIIYGIDLMVVQENNNKFHAMLLDCRYMGKSKDFDAVLYFDCAGRIELHKEIEWNTPH
jgi:hypothetical protein